LEERVYTDWYPFRLFRVGGAVFFDVGRAWGGENQNTVNPGWLSDVGFGLRILSARAAFGNVWHADVAFPLNADPSIQSVQFLFTTKHSF
jgi:hemolysin activation/secretion protein